jgi:hypothetical protein
MQSGAIRPFIREFDGFPAQAPGSPRHTGQPNYTGHPQKILVRLPS